MAIVVIALGVMVVLDPVFTGGSTTSTISGGIAHGIVEMAEMLYGWVFAVVRGSSSSSRSGLF